MTGKTVPFFDGRGNAFLGLIWGIGGAIFVVAPFLALSAHAHRISGSAVPWQDLWAILVFGLLGNLLEESLFRGYVYGLLARTMSHRGGHFIRCRICFLSQILR